jgi:hypothetical protein
VIHDRDLLDRLDAFPRETFDGQVFRATRQNLDPLVSSTSGGRWWSCDNLMLFPYSMDADARLEVLSRDNVDWVSWATDNGLLA